MAFWVLALYVDVGYMRVPQALGGARPRCASLDLKPGALGPSARQAGMPVFGFVGGTHHAGTNQAELLVEIGAETVFDDMTALPALIRAAADSRA